MKMNSEDYKELLKLLARTDHIENNNDDLVDYRDFIAKCERHKKTKSKESLDITMKKEALTHEMREFKQALD